MTHIAIRADGGPEIGYGHLVRTSALAAVVLSEGHRVTYLTTEPAHVRGVCPGDVQTVTLPSRDDPEPCIEWVESAAPDTVFTDAYPVDTEYQRAIYERAPLAVLQDDDRHAVCADVFINGNIYAADLEYQFASADTERLLGADYVLLRREIAKLAQQNPPWRETPERAVVLMGGSDIANLTPKAVRAFDNFDVTVDAIVGPGMSTTQERTVRKEAAEVPADVRVVREPDDLPTRMHRADFALSTASSVTYELLSLGTPIVSCSVAANQTLIARALTDRDLATVLTDPDVDTLRTAITEYMSDASTRRRRQRQGRRLVDGQGVSRLSASLRALS
ncbi:UDP-2,4-diacetamido-2,4,6-trideoxy-beta-L-altropyranose hydrolase [Haloarcula montana]|uniref:UDP-2,4-diacetamido-2,4, 6-trideoxy-beta-L-altropyranose hydrolase n=1 Tax=Haloarcula montana TaxID=3111776 RepID=UPI002D779736|nr:UDP-2,4-diacetamido-2,4,6-trideoxy-beta-L-altropyranose hydrolase [Haloarcula sp. GH36]